MNQVNYDEIGKQFAAQYYQALQTCRASIGAFYHARMTYEGVEVIGRENISQKLQCNTLQVALTSVDTHPSDNALLILVCGQLKVHAEHSSRTHGIVNSYC
ncbi:Nuclear transport factor 2 [Paragonimus heterotremus]|uniref:Nuclear transport factor 2 n=1 Tax=Paragonimus heterotremus TaxID=100268 RepID=A0A8J4SS04_9TREM|nr:Nuclear transport factor 2 [Paragonimus heterotremus]